LVNCAYCKRKIPRPLITWVDNKPFCNIDHSLKYERKQERIQKRQEKEAKAQKEQTTLIQVWEGND